MRLPFLKFGGLFGARRAPKPTRAVTLADVDPEYRRLQQQRDRHQSQHSKGARDMQRRLEAHVALRLRGHA